MVDPPETTTGCDDAGVTALGAPDETDPDEGDADEVDPDEPEPDEAEPDVGAPEELLPEAVAVAAPGSWCATTPATTAAAAAADPAIHRATRLGRSRAVSRRSAADGGRVEAGIAGTSSSILGGQPEPEMNFALAFAVSPNPASGCSGGAVSGADRAFSQVNRGRSSYYEQ
jgi:hypothetical protein